MKLNTIIENHLEDSQLDLADKNFHTEELNSKKLHSSTFENVVFDDIMMKHCDLTGSYFFNCTFKECQFLDVLLNKCEFHDCSFENSSFKNVQLIKSEFNRCELPEIKLADCELGWSFFNLCDLRNVYFNGVLLEGAIITDCKMFNQNPFVIDLGEKFPAQIINIDFTPDGDGSTLIQKKEFLGLIEGSITPNDPV